MTTSTSNKPSGCHARTASPVRAQLQLRQSFVFTQTLCMPQPEVLVTKAGDKFDAEGNLTDESTRAFLGKMLEAFAVWIRRVRD